MPRQCSRAAIRTFRSGTVRSTSWTCPSPCGPSSSSRDPSSATKSNRESPLCRKTKNSGFGSVLTFCRKNLEEQFLWKKWLPLGRPNWSPIDLDWSLWTPWKSWRSWNRDFRRLRKSGKDFGLLCKALPIENGNFKFNNVLGKFIKFCVERSHIKMIKYKVDSESRKNFTRTFDLVNPVTIYI